MNESKSVGWNSSDDEELTAKWMSPAEKFFQNLSSAVGIKAIQDDWYGLDGAFCRLVAGEEWYDCHIVKLELLYVPVENRGLGKGTELVLRAMALAASIPDCILVACPVPVQIPRWTAIRSTRFLDMDGSDVVTDSPRNGEMDWQQLREWYLRLGWRECEPHDITIGYGLSEQSERLGRKLIRFDGCIAAETGWEVEWA